MRTMKAGNRKRIVPIIVIVVAAALAYCVFTSLNGSLSRESAFTSKVREYVERKYPDEALEVSLAEYDNKGTGYFCRVASPISEDTHFMVWERNGVMEDDYDYCVVGRENTFHRLNLELEKCMDEILPDYPHRTWVTHIDCKSGVTVEEIAALDLDMRFDLYDFPFDCSLTVCSETEREAPTPEELAGRLRELDSFIGDRLPCVKYYSYYLQSRYTEQEDGFVPSDSGMDIYVYEIPKTVVEGDQLENELTGYLHR